MPKKTIFVEQRRREILQLAQVKGSVTVDELCDIYSVTNATIRADLCNLDSRGLLQRTHGGAICLTNNDLELTSSQKEDKFIEDKIAIGKIALNYVKSSDAIILDTGTTILQFAKQLKDIKNLTVFVYDLKTALVLEDLGIENIIFLGGTIRKNFHCTIGSTLIEDINNCHFDTCFVATNGLSIKRGLSTANINVADVKTAIIANSDKVISLCDSSKIGHDSTVSFASLKNVDTIITDKNINKEDLKQLKKIVNVVIA